MDNQAIIDKIADLSAKHATLLKQGKHAECNKIATQIRELRPRADYGFRKQELVEFKIRNRWMTAAIRDIHEDWQVDLGHTIVPVELIRKYERKPIEPEQINLFEEVESSE